MASFMSDGFQEALGESMTAFKFGGLVLKEEEKAALYAVTLKKQDVYIIDQARGQDGWIFAFLWTETRSRSMKTQKGNEAKRALKKMIFVLVCFRALKRKPVRCYKVMARVAISSVDKCRKYNHLIDYI